MRDTQDSETTEVEASAEALTRARDLLKLAERAAAASPGPLGHVAEDAAKAWVTTDVAEHRLADAYDAQIAGARRRERLAKLRAPLDLDAPEGPPRVVSVKKGANATSEDRHRATLAFIAGTDAVPHSEEEDLHPPRLDPTSADLERALATTPLQRRIADREARDA